MGYPDNFSSRFAPIFGTCADPRDLNAAELADIATERQAITILQAAYTAIAALPQKLTTKPDHEPRHVLMGLEDEIGRLRESIAEVERIPQHELETLEAA